MQQRILNRQLTSSPAEVNIGKEQEELKNFITNEVRKALIKFLSKKKLAV
jgi:hypothetical protein